MDRTDAGQLTDKRSSDEERTNTGRLRYPRYQGLCEDKNPSDVVREEA